MFVSASELIISAAEIWIMKDAFYALLAVGVAMMAAGAALSASVRYTGAFVGTGEAAAAGDTGSGLIMLGASAASVGVVGESVQSDFELTREKRQLKKKVLEIILEGHEVDEKVGGLAPGLREEIAKERKTILNRIYEELPDMIFAEFTEGQISDPYSLTGESKEFLIEILKASYAVGAEVLPLEEEHLSKASRHLYNMHQDHIAKNIVDDKAYAGIVGRIDDALESIYELRKARDPKSSVYDQRGIRRKVAEGVNAVARVVDKYRHGETAGNASSTSLISPMDELGEERLDEIEARMRRAKEVLNRKLEADDLKDELYQQDSKTLLDSRERKSVGPGIAGYIAKGYVKNPDRKAIAVLGAEHAPADSDYLELLKKAGIEYTIHDLSADYKKILKSNLDKNL